VAILSNQCPDRRIPDTKVLAREIAALERERNEKATEVRWRSATDDARIKLRHLYSTHQPRRDH